MIQNVERKVLYNAHWLLGIRPRLLQSFVRSKQPLWRYLPMLRFPQSSSLRWIPPATVLIHGTYVIWSSKGNEWCRGTYLPRGEVKQQVVAWTGMLVDVHHSYNNFDHYNFSSGRLQIQLSHPSAVQTSLILQTILATRRNGQYICVSEILTQRFDQSLRILQPLWLPLFLFLPHAA
jgi:hypothetical protein